MSNLWISNAIMNAWEVDPVPYEQVKHHEIGIVLTGVTSSVRLPKERVHYNKGVDRIYHALELYRLGKIDKILITGGTGKLGGSIQLESEKLKEYLLLAKVPEKDILIENRSRNTRENALYSKQTLDSLNITTKPLVITSAFHMRRAHGCFLKAGIDCDVFATDYYGRVGEWNPTFWLLPNMEAWTQWKVLSHEWVGYITYKLMGYA